MAAALLLVLTFAGCTTVEVTTIVTQPDLAPSAGFDGGPTATNPALDLASYPELDMSTAPVVVDMSAAPVVVDFSAPPADLSVHLVCNVSKFSNTQLGMDCGGHLDDTDPAGWCCGPCWYGSTPSGRTCCSNAGTNCSKDSECCGVAAGSHGHCLSGICYFG